MTPTPPLMTPNDTLEKPPLSLISTQLYHHTLSTHPINPPYQHTLSTHPINPPYHPLSTHPISTHPINPPYPPPIHPPHITPYHPISPHPITPYPPHISPLLHRFSADITQSDEKLASTIGWCLGVFVSMIGIIGTIAYSTNGSNSFFLLPTLSPPSHTLIPTPTVPTPTLPTLLPTPSLLNPPHSHPLPPPPHYPPTPSRPVPSPCPPAVCDLPPLSHPLTPPQFPLYPPLTHPLTPPIPPPLYPPHPSRPVLSPCPPAVRDLLARARVFSQDQHGIEAYREHLSITHIHRVPGSAAWGK